MNKDIKKKIDEIYLSLSLKNNTLQEVIENYPQAWYETNLLSRKINYLFNRISRKLHNAKNITYKSLKGDYSNTYTSYEIGEYYIYADPNVRKIKIKYDKYKDLRNEITNLFDFLNKINYIISNYKGLMEQKGKKCK